MKKNIFRKKAFDIRNSTYDENINKKIISKFLDSDIYKNSKNILLTSSIQTEIDTLPIIEKIFEDKKNLFLPITNVKDHTLSISRIKHYPQDLIESHYGILEPRFNQNINPQILDLVLVPGVAFDRRGYRIGYGAGYYDRFLLNTDAKRISMSRDNLLFDEIPYESYDLRVDLIFTETQTVKTGWIENESLFILFS